MRVKISKDHLSVARILKQGRKFLPCSPMQRSKMDGMYKLVECGVFLLLLLQHDPKQVVSKPVKTMCALLAYGEGVGETAEVLIDDCIVLISD